MKIELFTGWEERYKLHEQCGWMIPDSGERIALYLDDTIPVDTAYLLNTDNIQLTAKERENNE